MQMAEMEKNKMSKLGSLHHLSNYPIPMSRIQTKQCAVCTKLKQAIHLSPAPKSGGTDLVTYV